MKPIVVGVFCSLGRFVAGDVVYSGRFEACYLYTWDVMSPDVL